MIFSTFERLVAWRYLRARRQEGFISVITWFSLLGIALGVATLIVVMAVMNGFRAELFDRVLGLNGHLNIYSQQSTMLFDYENLAQNLRTIEGVKNISPSVEGQALISHKGTASGALVRGVKPSIFQNRAIIKNNIKYGDLKDFEGSKIAIGIRMAHRLNVKAGDKITLISPTSKTTIFGSAPRLRAFEIAAIFDVGMFEYDNAFVFMPLSQAQTFFQMGQGISTLEIFIDQPHKLRAMKQKLLKATEGYPIRLLDWQQSNSSFFTALQVEKNVMFLILTMIILVAAFNIISGMIMLVKDKGQDIAILRTMGASKGMIMRIFFLSGAAIGLVGTVAGLGLGLLIAGNIEHVRQVLQSLTGTELFSAEIYFLTHLPAIIDWNEVTQVILMSLGLSFLATLYPSWRAARLDPVEALRYE